MKYCLMLFLTTSLTIFTNGAFGEPEKDPVHGAMKAMDKFMSAFNARNIKEWSESLNYPHVRFASGQVRVWENTEAFISESDLSPLIESGWHHSRWISRDVVLSSPSKVHIATRFRRFNSDNEPISTYQSLYIVTLVDGHWGIQARSSLAP
jgi:hypothetical protein